MESYDVIVKNKEKRYSKFLATQNGRVSEKKRGKRTWYNSSICETAMPLPEERIKKIG